MFYNRLVELDTGDISRVKVASGMETLIFLLLPADEPAVLVMVGSSSGEKIWLDNSEMAL